MAQVPIDSVNYLLNNIIIYIRKEGVEDWVNTPSGYGVPCVYFKSDGTLWIYHPLGSNKVFKNGGIPIPSFNQWIKIYISSYAEGPTVTSP